MNSKIDRDDFGQIAALQRRADHQKVVTDLTSMVLEARKRTQEASAAADELRDMVTAGAAELASLRAALKYSESCVLQRDARIAEQETELAALRAENAHLKRALELSDALRNTERNLPL